MYECSALGGCSYMFVCTSKERFIYVLVNVYVFTFTFCNSVINEPRERERVPQQQGEKASSGLIIGICFKQVIPFVIPV